MAQDKELLAQLPPGGMLDELPFAVIATDLDGTIFYWNRAAESTYGFGRDRLLGANVTEVLVPVDGQDEGMDIMASVLAGHVWSGAFRVRRADGSTVRLHVTDAPLRGLDGRIVGVVGLAQELPAASSGEFLLGATEVSAPMRAARDKAAWLLETMATGFAALDRDWTVTYLNAAGAAVVGYTAVELVGRRLWDAFPGLEDLEFGRQYRWAVETGQPVEVTSYYPHLNAWFEVRAVPSADGLALYFTDITARQVVELEGQAATARLGLLAEVGRLLTESTDLDTGIAHLAEAVVPVLADWSLVTIRDEHGAFHDLGRAHRDPALRASLDAFADHLVASVTDDAAMSIVTRTGEPLLVRDYADTWLDRSLADEAARSLVRPLQPQSVLTVPVRGRQHTLGALSLVRNPGRSDPTQPEIDTAVEIGRRAGIALDNARLMRAQRRLSETLQDSLLSAPPQPDGLQIAVRYQAATADAAVGGDWYDSFLLPDGATALVVGDVSGHDRDAAAAMGQVRAMLRATAYAVEKPPAAILGALDSAMAGLAVNILATCILARIEQTEADAAAGRRVLRWSNAGHPPPMLVLPDHSVRILDGIPDLLLGLDPGSERANHVVELPKHSLLLLYTDGLIERRGEDLSSGLVRLQKTLLELQDRPLQDMCSTLIARMAPQADDDVALLAVRLAPTD